MEGRKEIIKMNILHTLLEWVIAHHTLLLDTLGVCCGLLYLYWEIKENAWMWVVGCIMPLIYSYVLYQAGLYADFGMEVYYLLAGLYGLYCWLRGSRRTGKTYQIRWTPPRLRLLLLSIALLLWGVLTFLLIRFTDSTVPVLDALTTALSVVALWMLSRKLVEQWWVWLVVNAISTGLYIYKDVYGRALLYAIYTVLAVYGYYKWRLAMVKAEASQQGKPHAG